MRLPLLSALVMGIAALTALLLTACGDDNGNSNANDDKVQVLTTLPLFADFAGNVGGDRVEVTSLLPLGADPHTFEPSPRDVEKVTQAGIVFANGFDLEPALIKLIEPNLPSGAPLILLAEEARDSGAATRAGGEGEGAEGHGIDPHMWMDPANALLYIAAIRDSLTKIDPDGAAEYAGNHDSYAGEIEETSNDVAASVDEIPDDLRKLVTTHDAFGYFADAFGLEVTEFVAEAPGGDPSPQDIADIAAVIEGQAVPAVFAEPQVHEEGQILEQAAADAGVEVCVLYSDSLDDTVTSYIELMRFNADELARCLGGAGGG